MGIQARQMARFAKKNKIQVRRGGIRLSKFSAPHTTDFCILGVFAAMANMEHGLYSEDRVFNTTRHQRHAMECGFEGWPTRINKRYYNLGKNFARLMSM